MILIGNWVFLALTDTTESGLKYVINFYLFGVGNVCMFCSHLEMGRMDIGIMRYLEHEHFRILTSIEMGMKNHELVPLQLIASIASIHRGAVARALSDLRKYSLVAYEKGPRYDGYRLTSLGYDFLALKALCSRNVVGSVGNQIGVGKESDIYVGGDPELNDLVLKFHHLGRTCFRKLKEKRDYLVKRRNYSWLYLARLAATKEFAFLKALYDCKFPVPKPIDCNRHTVVMSLIDGVPLCHVHELANPSDLYDKLMCLIVRLGRYGLIHGDFNEFNIILDKNAEPILIDFPQMVSTDHLNAAYYFDRDVECIQNFFRRRFLYESESYPKFCDVVRKHVLDVQLEASGFTKQMAKDLHAIYDKKNSEGRSEDESTESEAEGEEDGETEEETNNGDENNEEEEILDRGEGSERLNKWIQDARAQLESIIVEEKMNEGGCPKHISRTEKCENDGQLVSLEPRAADRLPRSQKVENDECGDQENNVGETSETDEGNLNQSSLPVTKSKSVYSTGSTYSPEDIRKRLMLEARAKNKMKLRIKGKASATNRGRKLNKDVIKEYAGWDIY
ncbi:hypothetical protein AB6A40_000955 [Gnathostoma spinigerum]|uniref:Serine/threonine-protein kinase RIO2 n=1 Tax=Gnathostoma spinigerum TaxID=75299 RepID=A0ABD6EA10_9BILA